MIRKAKISDVKDVQKLINRESEKGKILPRSLSEIYELLRDFWVYEEKSKICGCCALHITWEDLGEIRSLVINEKRQRKGIGTTFLKKALKEAVKLNLKKVFALTYIPEFFEKQGFKRVRKSQLPHKVWAECIKCPKFPDCDEIALIKKI